MTSFEVGAKVHRTKERTSEIGEIVEINGDRVRVLWPGFPDEDQRYNYNRPKRTWIKKSTLTIAK